MTLHFATHDGVELFGDLYRPDGQGPYPVVVAVPGGGWLRGDRKDLAHWGQAFAAAGVAMFAVDYRRSTDGRIFPENVRDVWQAVRFIHGESANLGLDRDRMGLLGASAGAHLAALAALANRSPLLAGAYPDDPHASAVPKMRVLVGVYGAYDLEAHCRACAAADVTLRDDLAERMMGLRPGDAPEAFAAASPITHVHNARGMDVLLAWGDSDTTILPRQSELFGMALREAGANVTEVPVAGAGHFWFSKEKDIRAGANGYLAPGLVAFLKDKLQS